MNFKINRKSIVQKSFYIFTAITLCIQTSCVNTKQAVYFPDLQDAAIQSNNKAPQNLIESNDLLSISVNSLDPEATQMFNALNMAGAISSTAAGTTTQAYGYLVDAEGYVKLPLLGRIKASGMSESGLSDYIAKTLVDKKLLLDPVVNVRHLNFKVTVLGEVGRPTVVTVPNGKISLLEALGLAGDLTIYARRDNVLVIREENGQKIIKRINLNSNDLLKSPYYYLRSNDVVYAEPNKARISSSGRGQQLLPIIFGGLSFITIVVDRLTR